MTGQCVFDGQLLDVGQALALRDEIANRQRRAPDFRCVNCGQAVRVHAGRHPHFEHRAGSQRCAAGMGAAVPAT